MLGNLRIELLRNKWGEEQRLLPEQAAVSFRSEGCWIQSTPVARISSTKLNQKRLMPTARFQHGGNITQLYFCIRARYRYDLSLYTNSIKTNPGLAADLALNISTLRAVRDFNKEIFLQLNANYMKLPFQVA